MSQAFLKRRKKTAWWKDEWEYEQVTVLAVGPRHKGNYPGGSFDYEAVLILNEDGEREEVSSSQLFWPKTESPQ